MNMIYIVTHLMCVLFCLKGSQKILTYPVWGIIGAKSTGSYSQSVYWSVGLHTDVKADLPYRSRGYGL